MGSGSSRSIPRLVAGMERCVIPEDREHLLDYMEAVVSAVGSVVGKQAASVAFHRARGVPLLARLMKELLLDDSVIRAAAMILDYQKDNRDVLVDFIRCGGLVILQDCLREHEMNSILMTLLKNLQTNVRAAGASYAMEEINEEAASLHLCSKCQATMRRLKGRQFTSNGLSSGGGGGSSSSTSDSENTMARVQRVLANMRSYISRRDVAKCGLDALIAFTAHEESEDALRECRVLDLLRDVVEEYRKDGDVLWRLGVCMRQIVLVSDAIAFDLVKSGAVEALVSTYKAYTDYRLRQQIMWLLDALVAPARPLAMSQVFASSECMAVIRGTFDEKRKLQQKYKHFPPKDKFELYRVVMPHTLREFAKETEGKTYEAVVAAANVDTAAIEDMELAALRRKAKPTKSPFAQPMYGTVQSKIYTQPEDGTVRLAD